MTRNRSFKRFMSGTLGAVMFLSALPTIAANAAVGTTVLTYDDYEVNYAVTNEWNGGQNVLITVTNLSDESLYNWAFKFDASASLEGLYNANVFENEDTEYIVKNNGWNFEIAPQRSVSFGYTIRGDELSVPDSFELCSERVDVTEGYDVDVNYQDVWNDGMRGEIVVTNTTDEPMEAWTLAFDTNFQIEYVWNGRALDTDGNHYVVGSEAWTQYIAPGASKTIGFVGTKEPGTDPVFSNYELTMVKINGLHSSGQQVNIDMDTDNIDLGYLETLIDAGLIDVNFDENSQTRAIYGKFTNKTANNAEEVAHILNCAKKLFGEGFSVTAAEITDQTDGDETYYRCSVSKNGIPVVGSQIILTAKDGVVTGMYSKYNKFADTLSTNPTLSSTSAAAIASEDAFADLFDRYDFVVESVSDYSGITEEEAIALFKASFDVVPTLVIDASHNVPVLAWNVKVVNNNFKEEEEIDYDDVNDYTKYVFNFVNYEYYITADGSGAGTIYMQNCSDKFVDWESDLGEGDDVLGNPREFNVQHGTNGKYRMKDVVRNIETYETKFNPATHLPLALNENRIHTSDTSTFNDVNAVSAHANMSQVYDYYLNVLGRDSFDNHHAPIRVATGYRQNSAVPFENAAWIEGQSMFVFGDLGDFEACKDIVAHEFTHAVVDNVIHGNGPSDAGLLYYGEPGALNEALADILGSLAEGKARTDAGRWTIGEDTDTFIRSMADPESVLDENGNPINADHYDDTKNAVWIARAAGDNGGVHTYSTIFSRAAYIMMNDSRMSNITDNKWARVFYKAMYRLTYTSRFIDGRYAVIGAAKGLGFTDAQVEAIGEAFDAVGIKLVNSVRIVLEWGATPSDLDSHLTGPAVDGNGRFHTYYSQRNYYLNGTYAATNTDYAAELDHDDVDSFGPEVTTIHAFTEGDYFFYIHDFTNRGYTNSTAMSTSGVTVKIFKSSTNELFKLSDGSDAVFSISDVQAATLWKVCKISIDAYGEVTVEKVDTYSNVSSPAAVGA